MYRALVFLTALFAIAITAAPSAAQQMWAPAGVSLCQSECPGDIPQIVPDGAAGAYVAWRDLRTYSTTDYDVYMQHVTGLGLIAPGWPADALPVVALPGYQGFSGLTPDGFGGALVAWEDWRNLATSSRDPFVQRVLVNGTFPPGWTLNGNPATLTAAAQYTPVVAPDGAGGAYVAWEDDRDYATHNFDLYAQHLTASGAIAPGWPAGGAVLCALPGVQEDVFVFPDDAGGALFVWFDDRPTAPGAYALRLHADGSIATGWAANGIPIELGQPLRGAARDEAGGFYVVNATAGANGFDAAYYLFRYTFDGVPAPSWPAGGVLVCNAPGIRAGAPIDADGTGGALLCWYDYRPPFDVTGGKIFAIRVLSGGSLAPGWTVNGTLVSDPTDGFQSFAPSVVHDGQGGGYLVWQLETNCCSPSDIQHLTGSGQVAAGWPRYGLRVAPSDDQFNPQVASDGQGGAIVAWDEEGSGRLGVWAQRFGANGPTPVLLSLVSAAATDGRVALDWFAAAGAEVQATAYRRTASSSWLALGSVSADGTGHLRYEDGAVSPGERYAYRLGYLEGSVEQFSSETWVEVPALRLALEGLRPNPAVGELVASFTLPSAAPARLELLDVTGRIWLTRGVGALGAGNHLARLGQGMSVPAGMYWLRLTQGNRSLLARGVVVR